MSDQGLGRARGRGRGLGRRSLLGAAAASLASLAGCRPGASSSNDTVSWSGGWVGAAHERGHLLRSGPPGTKSGAWPEPAVVKRAGVVVVGGGIGGLAAARALVACGVDDFALLELEDAAGGNSRSHAIAGMRCPLGAHYLPVPGERAGEVLALLDELGVRKEDAAGRSIYDERMLCHSPQERLFIGGFWREGLLPPVDALPAAERARTSAQYQAFGRAVAAAGGPDAFAIPTARSRWSDALDAFDAVTFAAWLDGRGFDAPALRWYLDYCCRDDYGADAAQVSAWAGIHYFASRHGFHAPGTEDGPAADGGEGVLTWPEGNAWLSERMAAPLGDRLHAGRVVLRLREGRGAVEVDAWNVPLARLERWIAPQAVLATPLFVARRLHETPGAALASAAAALPHTPWLVANLHLDAPLDDRPGAPPSWDNVAYRPAASASLGYVDATHQSLMPYAGATVLTAYWAFGGGDAATLADGRARLLSDSWGDWSRRVVADLTPPHPDLPAKLRRVDLMRYGHAMALPVPGVRSSAALRALAAPQRRVHFAHSDLAAYSVFEEALYHGTRAGHAAAGAALATGAARAVGNVKSRS